MVDPGQMGGGGAPPGGPGGAPGGPGGGAPGGAPDPMAMLAMAKLARRKRHPAAAKKKAHSKRKAK